MPPEIQPRPTMPAGPSAIERLTEEVSLLREELRTRDDRILSVLQRIEANYEALRNEHRNLERRILALESRERSDPLVSKAKRRAKKVRRK